MMGNEPFRPFHLSDRKSHTELWHVFHDELDLDGNGHLDAEELGWPGKGWSV